MDLKEIKNIKPFLSVIVPAHNEEKFIAELLRALVHQKCPVSWELIVADNNSSDRTREIVRRFMGIVPNMTMVNATEKQSPGYARNVGAYKAEGQVFAFCDAHVVVAEGWIAAMYKALTGHDFVTGLMEFEKLNKPSKLSKPFNNGSRFKFMGYLPFAGGANMGISKRAFNAVGGFSEDIIIGEDADISFRLQLAGYTLYDAEDAVVYVRYRETNIEKIKQNIAYGKAHVLLYKKFASKGFPRRGLREGFKTYKRLGRNAHRVVLGSSKERQQWLQSAAANWGRFSGSLKYRTLYL